MARNSTSATKPRSTTAQAWIQLRVDDPAAVSAFAVVNRGLTGGAGLRSLERWRVLELAGSLPDREALQDHLHASTQFFNPHKETCSLRMHAGETTPAKSGAHAILVLDRDDVRRPAAERWWRQETGKRVAVREGIVWVLEFEPAVDGAGATKSLSNVRDRHHGLFCNPHSQESSITDDHVPLPWIATSSRTGVKT